MSKAGITPKPLLAANPSPNALFSCPRSASALILGLVLLCFVTLQCLLPLRTAIKIGADEDYELSKATVCLRGYHLYTEVWNDQTPLDPYIITLLAKYVSPSILVPRLMTVFFATLLLGSTFFLVRRLHGVAAASLATVMLLASPGFLELSSSAMQEIPAMAPAAAALAVLWTRSQGRWRSTEVFGGVLMGFALQMKLLDALYLPLAAIIIFLRNHERSSSTKYVIYSCLAFGVSAVASFVLLNWLTGCPLLLQFQQSWNSHFAPTRSFEYGSPVDKPFDWGVLLRNWDTTAPALIGIVFLLREFRISPGNALPLAWLALTLLVFSLHHPWWAYYYVHNSLPLCWCAGVGIAKTIKVLKLRRARVSFGFTALFFLSSATWMTARVILQEMSIRSSPRLYSCLVLKEIERFKPFTTFMFTDQPIFSFHAQIPLPPDLAVISLKRLWSGGMSNAKLETELKETKPGLILLANNGLEVPYQALLNRDYRLVYRDESNRLYVHQSIVTKPGI